MEINKYFTSSLVCSLHTFRSWGRFIGISKSFRGIFEYFGEQICEMGNEVGSEEY